MNTGTPRPQSRTGHGLIGMPPGYQYGQNKLLVSQRMSYSKGAAYTILLGGKVRLVALQLKEGLGVPNDVDEGYHSSHYRYCVNPEYSAYTSESIMAPIVFMTVIFRKDDATGRCVADVLCEREPAFRSLFAANGTPKVFCDPCDGSNRLESFLDQRRSYILLVQGGDDDPSDSHVYNRASSEPNWATDPPHSWGQGTLFPQYALGRVSCLESVTALGQQSLASSSMSNFSCTICFRYSKQEVDEPFPPPNNKRLVIEDVQNWADNFSVNGVWGASVGLRECPESYYEYLHTYRNIQTSWCPAPSNNSIFEQFYPSQTRSPTPGFYAAQARVPSRALNRPQSRMQRRNQSMPPLPLIYDDCYLRAPSPSPWSRR